MNQLKIIYMQRKQDRRYRIMVDLVRADRPKYWHFRCIHCGASVQYIQNANIVGMTDFYDQQDLNNWGTAKDCKGLDEQTGAACPYTYFFNCH